MNKIINEGLDKLLIKEGFEPNILDESIPRDLASAYRRSDYIDNDRRNSRFNRRDFDYHNATYTEITPEEALEYKKNGHLDDLRILINGDLVKYSKGSNRQQDYSTSVPYNKVYTNKKGNKIFNTNQMPLEYILQIADKIYYTNEEYLGFLPEIQSRKQYNQDYNVDTGKHSEAYNYRYKLYYAAQIKKYMKDLRELEAKKSTIHPQDYKRTKEYIEHNLNVAKETFDYYTKEVTKGKKDSSKRLAQQRYSKSEETLQQNIRKLSDLRRQIYNSSQELGRLKSGTNWNRNKYDEYQEKIKQLMDEIEKLQNRLAEYEWKANDELKTSENARIAKEIQTVEDKLQDLEDQKSALFQRGK